MSLKKLLTGHTVAPLEGEDSARHERFGGIGRMVRLDPGAWVLPSTFSYFADSLYNYKMFRDDVVVMGFPKTGTTWLQEIVWTMRNNPNFDNPQAEQPIYARSFYLEGDPFLTPKIAERVRRTFKDKTGVDLPLLKEELPVGGNQEDWQVSAYVPPEGLVLPLIEMLPRPRTFKTHLAFPLHNPKLLDTAKVIYIVRNPKDVILSFYHNTRLMNLWKFSGDFDDTLDAVVSDETFYGPFWAHLREALSRKGHPNLLLMQYEKLRRDVQGHLSDLNTFLQTGLSEAQLSKIAEYVKFENMKARNTTLPVDILHEDVVKKDGGFFRKGQVGDWKGKLTPQQEAKIDAWIAKNSKDLDMDLEYA